MSVRIDVNWYKILGLPDPEKYPRDPSLGEVEFFSESKVKWGLFCDWIKDNNILVALIVLGVFFGVLWLRKG